VRTACRGGRDVGLHRPPARSAGSGNCDQARLAVTDYAMAHRRRVDTRPGAPRVLAKHPVPAQRARRRDSRVPRASSMDWPRQNSPPDRQQGQPGGRRHERAGRHRHPHPCRAGRKVRAAMRRARAAALARGAFISARVFRAASGIGQRQDGATNVIAAGVPGHAGHSEHDADPGSRSPAIWSARSSPRTRRCTAERCCTPSDRHSEPVTAPGSPMGETGDTAGAGDQFAAPAPSPSASAPHRAHRSQPQGPSRALPLPPDTQQTA